MDALIEAMDENKEQENRKKDAEDKKKKELREGGETVRDAAVKRIRDGDDKTDGGKAPRKRVKV